MTIDEYNSLLEKAANPDTGIESLSVLREEGKGIFDTIDSLTAKLAESETRIRDLQDSNMKLFLKIGTPEKVEKTVDEDAELEKEFNAMFNGTDKKED